MERLACNRVLGWIVYSQDAHHHRVGGYEAIESPVNGTLNEQPSRRVLFLMRDVVSLLQTVQ